MFLCNDSGGDGCWVNGMIGEVVKISDIVVVDVDGEWYEVWLVIWECYCYSYMVVIKIFNKDVVVEFMQFFLWLVWVVIIYKFQGKSYECVIVDFGECSFVFGQIYVVLLWIIEFEGLYFICFLCFSDIIVDENVICFMSCVQVLFGIVVVVVCQVMFLFYWLRRWQCVCYGESLC